ncbi:hypothetical protein [Erythrobacter sp. MTPC3]|uniref:hypothetical protein n=1 Tax=Erythrobacter sp. MTPC3 TaxID=3056564 RepID=UPI0036F29520
MFTHITAAALLALTTQAPAASMHQVQLSPALSQQSKALVRCSAAFALISYGQDIGNEAALKWPVLETRGKEFFVRALAQLMDETGLDREGISALVGAEAQRLTDAGETEKVMPACLIMLDGSGL